MSPHLAIKIYKPVTYPRPIECISLPSCEWLKDDDNCSSFSSVATHMHIRSMGIDFYEMFCLTKKWKLASHVRKWLYGKITVCMSNNICPVPKATWNCKMVYNWKQSYHSSSQALFTLLTEGLEYPRSNKIKTHGRVSAAKKAVWHTSVLFTGTANLPFSTPHISITTGPLSIKFTYFMPSIYATLNTKFERNWLNTLRDICSWKLPHFLHLFFLLLRTVLQK